MIEDVFLRGYPPELKEAPGNPEALKYGKLWERPEYRAHSPGEVLAQVFLQQARPKSGASVIDFGCGTGRGALMLAVLGGLNVTMVDFVGNCLDPEIREALATQAHTLRFLKTDLEKQLPIAAEYGYCTDVMEHIPPDKVDRVLDNILRSAQHVFFSIATEEDRCGALIGQPLHLSIHPFSWWLAKFSERQCVIHWSQELAGECLFYLSAWSSGQEILDSAKLNIEDEKIRANVRANCAAGWQQVKPHETNDLELIMLGGGPSMAEFEPTIRRMREEGAKLITLNGSYNWALDHGLKPSAQIIVDARPFNARFTKPVVDDCKYLLASQCDPACFEGLPKERTYLWHTAVGAIQDILKEHYELWWPVPSCSTVLLTGILLLRMLGFKRFHLFGCDSCLQEQSAKSIEQGAEDPDALPSAPSALLHHAYSQPENDSEFVVPVLVNGGRIFYCHPWMIGQAQSFIDLIKVFGDEIEIEIYGDGLLAHVLRTGAEAANVMKMSS